MAAQLGMVVPCQAEKMVESKPLKVPSEGIVGQDIDWGLSCALRFDALRFDALKPLGDSDTQVPKPFCLVLDLSANPLSLVIPIPVPFFPSWAFLHLLIVRCCTPSLAGERLRIGSSTLCLWACGRYRKQ